MKKEEIKKMVRKIRAKKWEIPTDKPPRAFHVINQKVVTNLWEELQEVKKTKKAGKYGKMPRSPVCIVSSDQRQVDRLWDEIQKVLENK